MGKWWLVVGSPTNWQTAFEHGNLWGFKPGQRDLWEHLEKGDRLLLYAARPVSGVIGVGTMRGRFVQDIPLWPDEVERKQALWPLRIEMDVDYCLPQGRWEQERVTVAELQRKVRRRQTLQLVEEQFVREVAAALPESAAQMMVEPRAEPAPADLHGRTIRQLLDIGRLQNFIAEKEYDVDIGKVDVVWRRVARAVPNYVFEVHIGGSLDRDLAKLKHAYDIWNSNIFLVSVPEERERVNNLLSGAFHEIKARLKFIEVGRIADLSERKRSVHELEEELGII
jgi:predicted RNA-binding protein